MKNVLTFIKTANENNLFKLQEAIEARIENILLERSAQIEENEQRERTALWQVWQNSAISLMATGLSKGAAIEESFKSLSNLWIQRNEETTCPECGEDYDEYYEFIFDHSITACCLCTDCVDLRPVFTHMAAEMQKSKKLAI